MESPESAVERKRSLPGLAIIRRLQETCRLEAISLQEGGLSGAFGSYQHCGASFCSFVTDFALHGRFVLPQGHYLACYLHDVAPESWCAGMSLAPGTMLLVLPGSACELMLGPASRVSMALVPLHGGAKRAIDAHADFFNLPGRQFTLFKPECHRGTPLQALYGMLYQGLVEGNSQQLWRLTESGSVDFLADERGIRALSDQGGLHTPYCANYRASYPAFRKAVQYMRENLQRDIYMDEVAAAAQISDRSLRMSFDDLLSVSPTRYLTLLRLHEASRQLSMRSTERLSVKSVAMSCGIWNLSRFAANYRRAFDEHPSDTLMRACSFAS
ncbi:AraC family transcriptional regulator [Dyella nitratireducens]|uniref:HTH araC/xylS-type domain-containing protein n=1 Tax=Dyella nitratireducens TaxID=1849580 RepID=A0ABQ1GFH0_9GAMM|nr:AraC family transcriptional regulator [Dyella nitratireducens]GGA42511.1 hypothetical protein GCM10010981_34520 [Dyella nitratireducens]GLQ41991.1 hypothetical protein GCM10007902_18410 [Dyella nitratireducens]